MPPDAVEWQQASGFCFQQKLCWEDSGKLGKHVTVQDFRPISTLGRGNMGTVLLVAMNHINSPFAMKIKKKQATKKPPSQHTDMEREILSLLHHPFLPTLHAHFEFEKHSLLVIDFCSGGDLNVLRHRQPEKRFSERATQFYAAEVLVALEHLHNLGIVYRDLKPENILIQESGHIMLTDFDLSVRLNAPDSAGMRRSISLRQPEDVIIQSRKPREWLSLLECFRMCSTKERPKPNGSLIPPRRGVITPLDSRLTDARAQPAEDIYFVGTEEYVAPEILRGLDHGFAVDWWSFGVFLYELSYGETPFKGRSPKETFSNILENDPELPGSRSPLKDMIQRLLVKEPSRRLGFGSGADEIKCHKFFEGLRWETLEFLCRTPFIPPPFSLSEFEGNRNQNRLLKKENTWYERDPSSSPRGSCGSGNSGEEVSLEEIFTVRDMLSQSNSEEK